MKDDKLRTAAADVLTHASGLCSDMSEIPTRFLDALEAALNAPRETPSSMTLVEAVDAVAGIESVIADIDQNGKVFFYCFYCDGSGTRTRNEFRHSDGCCGEALRAAVTET